MKSPPYQEGDSTLFNLHDEGSDSTPSHTADKYGPTLSVSDDAHMAVDCPFVYSSNTTWTPCTPPTGRVNVNTKTFDSGTKAQIQRIPSCSQDCWYMKDDSGLTVQEHLVFVLIAISKYCTLLTCQFQLQRVLSLVIILHLGPFMEFIGFQVIARRIFLVL